ncbi:anti-sigma F factor antagonist [Pelosinus sp. IPA-1]|uniref:anti-sigma F factor antagonist n=1 Tax=Pelosinus sp. IPA-1 TaxID=3029569 RepID=UPI0024361AC1|nr:anti-sigma F factor antagonist [Pelosinus sp. IPA-1]GMA99208.1 anti-sigma F factor antagonist [Pelosinus sp. IPA-1]
MNITTSLKRGVLLVRVEGELDMHVAAEFRQKVDNALETSGVQKVLFNLQGVDFIDSSGLGVLLGRYKKISGLGGVMSATQIQPQVSQIFELSGLLKIIKLYHSEKEALECL